MHPNVLRRGLIRGTAGTALQGAAHPLRAAGPAPTRSGQLAALGGFDTDLGGLALRWRQGGHTGSSVADLALVRRDGRFVP